MLATTIAIGILKKSRCKEGNRDMGRKSNIKEDKYWTIEEMIENVLTGKKPKV